MRVDQTEVLSINVKVALPEFTLDVDEQIQLSRVTGLFGPSGGGKSTLLRVISGLEPSSMGRIEFAGATWQDSDNRLYIPPYQRSVGYVFQDARLFEHLSVEGNLRYALKRNEAKEAPIRYDEVLATFDLPSLLARSVTSLSGGERQRVAIARTLLSQPRLLLLDEPLAALDTSRKEEILPYLEDLPGRFGIPAIYVSHAIDEIARLADQVIVLEQGKVMATGNAAETLNQLALQSPASRFDAMTILEATVIEHVTDLDVTRLDFRGQIIVVPTLSRRQIGDAVRLHIRAGDIALATREPQHLSFRNILSGTLADIEDSSGAFTMVSIDVDGTLLRAELTRHAVQDLELKVGMPVFALLKTASFDRRK